MFVLVDPREPVVLFNDKIYNSGEGEDDFQTSSCRWQHEQSSTGFVNKEIGWSQTINNGKLT